jgi:hypothetical protein
MARYLALENLVFSGPCSAWWRGWGIGTTYRDGELVCVPLGPGRTNNLRRSHGSTAQGAHEGLEVTLHRTRDVRFDTG